MKLHITLGLCALAACSYGQILSESFQGLVQEPSETSDITPLMTAGWVVDNNSSPAGTTSWFGSNFDSNGMISNPDGNPMDSFIAADYNAAGGAGTIDDWLITPEVALGTGYTFTFQTISAQMYPDAMNIMLSTSGSSTNLSDFTTTLLQINPGLTPTGYPGSWTTYMVTLPSGIAVGSMGRFAFDYSVTDGGPLGANSDFIGVANLVYAVPEPAPFAVLGLGALFFVRRPRRK